MRRGRHLVKQARNARQCAGRGKPGRYDNRLGERLLACSWKVNPILGDSIETGHQPPSDRAAEFRRTQPYRRLAMRLDSIHLTNYRCHADLAVNFAPGFNVVVGINGSGKTSLLKGVCDSLSGLLVGMNMPHHIQPINEPGYVRLLATSAAGRFRFEPQYPVKVGASGEAYDTGCVWTWTRTSQVDNAQLSGRFPGQIWQSIQQGSGPGAEAKLAATHLPLIAFYRANRHWNQPQPHEMQAATQRNSRTDGYASWWDASLDSTCLAGVGDCQVPGTLSNLVRDWRAVRRHRKR